MAKTRNKKVRRKTAVKGRTKRTKAAPARKKKSRAVAKAKSKASSKASSKARSKTKSKPAPKKKKRARKAKPESIGQKVAGAFGAVVDTLAEARSLRDKLEPPGSSETE